MSMWLDPPDESADEGLGAGLGLPPALDAGDTYESDEPWQRPEDGDPWTPSAGYPDSSQSVRIWVDSDRRLTNVHVSNLWRDRAKGTSLSSMFDEAFLLATAQLPDDADDAQAVDDGDDANSAEPLSWDSVEAALARVDQIQARMAELESRPADEVEPSRWVGREVVATSANRMVEVTLDIHGLTRRIQFNEAWLAQSRVSEVRDSVLQAHHAAYASFEPPTFEPGEHSRLAAEAHRLTEQTMSLMRQGGSR